MICAQDKKFPKVREEILNLADKLGVDYGTAKVIYESNNGYGLDKAPNGAESKLYEILLEHYGDELRALIAKARTHLAPFKNWFGDWTQTMEYVDLKETESFGTGRTTFKTFSIDGDKGFIDITLDKKDKKIQILSVSAEKGLGLGQKTYLTLQKLFPEYQIISDPSALSKDAEKMWERLVSRNLAIKKGEKDYILKASVSKVVDENGEPLVVWHGTTEEFDEFSIVLRGSTDPGDFGLGFYFSPHKDISLMYGNIVNPYFLNIKNPVPEALYKKIDAFGRSKASPLTLHEKLTKDIKVTKFIIEGVEEKLYGNDPLHELYRREPAKSYLLAELEMSQHKLNDLQTQLSTKTKKELYSDLNEQWNSDVLEINRFDGVIPEQNEPVFVNHEIVAATPNQIKHIDNNGNFSTIDDNTYHNQQSSEQSSSSDPTLQSRLFNGDLEVSIGTMLTRLSKDNPHFNTVIKLLKNSLPTNVKGWKIVLQDEVYDGSAAVFDPKTNTIHVDRNASFKGKDGKADNTILHEIIHAAAVHAVNNNDLIREKLESILSHIRKQLEKKYKKSYEQLLKEDIDKWYGLKNIHELLSEAVSNSSFMLELSNIPSKEKGLKTAFKEFLNWLLSVFKVSSTDNSLNEVLALLEDIITNQQSFNEIQDYEFAPAPLAMHQAKNNINALVDKYRQMSEEVELITRRGDEDVHIYVNKRTGKVYKSVSDVKTEVGYGELEDKLPEHAIALGNFAKVKGTLMHAALSDLLVDKFNKNNYPELSSTVIKQLRTIAKNIKSKYKIISSEQILFDEQTGIAGTADLIVQDKKTNKVIILDFKTKIKNLGDLKKSGFAYYNSSKFGRPDSEKHNFQLTMYEKMHNLLGFDIDERGIVPIEYDTDNDGNITNVYLTPQVKGTTLEEKGYYTSPHRSQIDLDIQTYVFTENPDKIMDNILIKKQSEIIAQIITSLKNKVVALHAKGRKTQATDIESTLGEFNSLSEQEILLSYIKAAFDNLKNIIEGRKGYNERLQQEKTEGNTVWNLRQLESWRDVARSFELLNDIQQYLFDYNDVFDKSTYDTIMPLLDEAVRYRNILEKAYKTKGKALWVLWISPFIKNIEGAYRLKAEREYKKTHKVNDEQSRLDMQAYINKYIEDNKIQIEIETKNFIERLTIEADQDVNGFYRWVDTIFLSQDPVIQGMALAYDEMMQQTRETYNVKYKLLVDLTREMEEQFGSSVTSDPKQVYDYMLEVTENGVSLVQEIPGSFTEAYKKKMDEIDKDVNYKNGMERFKAKMKWLDENAPIKDKAALKEAKKRAIEEYLDSIDISDEEYSAILNNESKKGKKRMSYFEMAKEGIISYKRADDLREIVENVTWKFRKVKPELYPNKKYDTIQKIRQENPQDIRVRFYDFIVQLSKEGDSRVAPRYKLNGRLPGVTKTYVERLAAGQNAGSVIKEEISKTVSLRADDTMYGQFEMTDESNRPINFIPVFYTSRLKEEDQSYDLPTIYKEWFKSALTYANTNEIIDQLEFTRFIVNDRKTKTGGKSYTSKVLERLGLQTDEQESESTKDDSNLAALLNDWFDLIVYGKGTDPMGKSGELPFFGNIDFGKAVNAFTKYASLRVMGLNYISMVNNALMAEVSQAIEVSANKYVSAASYTKATAEYTLDLPNILGDVGARKPTSKTNLLNELFGTFIDYDEGRMRLSSKFSRLFNSGALYFTTNMGEHEAQSRFLLASLINARAYDANGNDIGSIYDYYEVENDHLVFDKEGKVANWSDSDRRKFSSKVRSQLMSMHGNYSQDWKVALQRNGYLRMALMFRKWIVPSVKKRWEGLYYDNVTEDYKEGYYRTSAKFALNKLKYFYYSLIDEAKAAEIASVADWNSLTEMEKQNCKRMFTEISILVAMHILYTVLKRAADDDDDVILNNFAYQAYRLKVDMGFYWNPRDAFKIIQSPFPSTSAVKSLSGLFDSILNPLDRYERGPWKDRLKIEKRVYDLMPAVRQIYRARDIEEEFNILNMK